MFTTALHIAVWLAAVGLLVLAWWRPGLAMITSVLLSAGPVAASLALCPDAVDYMPLLLMPMTFLAVYLMPRPRGRLLWPNGQPMADPSLGPDGPGGKRPMARELARAILIVTLTMSILAWCAAGLAFGAAWFAILAVLALRFALAGRRAKTHCVVSTLSACMRQNLPLVQGLQAAASDRQDAWGWTLRRISQALATGTSLADAVFRGFPGCSGEVLATIRAAEKAGQLPRAMQCLEADLLAGHAERRRMQPSLAWYPLVLLLAVTAFAGLPLRFFGRVLRQPGFPLPATTESMIGLATAVSGIRGWFLLLLVVGAALAVYVLFRPRRADRFQLLAWLGDRIVWHVPAARWFARNRSMLQVVEVLRLWLEGGRPVDQAIAATIELDVNGCFRRRLRAWLRRVREGHDVAEAARAAGLGRALAWAIDARVNPANVPGALAALESVLRWRYSYLRKLLRLAAWPTTVLALGAMVGWIACAVVMALNEMARQAGGAHLP